MDGTREGNSEAQRGAQPLMRFNIYSRLDHFADTLDLTPAQYRTLTQLHFKLIQVDDIEDDIVAEWLNDPEPELTPEELEDRENASYAADNSEEYERRANGYGPYIDPMPEDDEDGDE